MTSSPLQFTPQQLIQQAELLVRHQANGQRIRQLTLHVPGLALQATDDQPQFAQFVETLKNHPACDTAALQAALDATEPGDYPLLSTL